MSNFLKNYKDWEKLKINEKMSSLLECARFYEQKTVDYILANLPKKKQKEFTKEPVDVVFEKSGEKDVWFGDNVVHVSHTFENLPKKDLFFKVAQNTICAVFVNLFYNTAGNPNKKTRFGNIANGFLASITSEFAKNQEFEADMISAYTEILGEVLDMGGIEQ